MPATLSFPYNPMVVAGTSVQFVWCPDLEQEGAPELKKERHFPRDIISSLNYNWEEEISDNFSFIKQSIIDYQRIKILERLASDILEHSEDLSPAFAAIINENFWDLI